MVKLNKIYTRGGDEGWTSYADGKRVPKHALRVEAYGTVDETNAVIGLARLQAKGETAEMLERIQQDLFDLGADLATPGDEFEDDATLRITQDQVDRLEAEIDDLNAVLAPLSSFILPGGGAAAAYVHVARTVARRAERRITALAENEPVNPAAIRYMNRLSDHLFVLARHFNRDGEDDVLWVPGINR